MPAFPIAARRSLVGFVVVLVLGSAAIVAGGSARGATTTTLVKHVGPVGVIAGQSAKLVFTNGGEATVSPTLALIDAAGTVLTRVRYAVAPGVSEVLDWTAQGPRTVRGVMVLSSATVDVYPVAMHIYDPPVLDTPGNVLDTNVITVDFGLPHQNKPKGYCCPYVPILAVAKSVINVTNLGRLSASFTVSFFDSDGNLLSPHAVRIGPARTASVQFTGDTSNGVRAELAAPDGAVYLVTGEIVDPTSGKTLVHYNVP